MLCRARQHLASGGCGLIADLASEPLAESATVTVTYLSLLPMRFSESRSGRASAVSSALPHFVELLVTRAIGTEGFATGGLMRSPPGDTMSWASHGATVASLMRAMAGARGLLTRSVGELISALRGLV